MSYSTPHFQIITRNNATNVVLINYTVYGLPPNFVMHSEVFICGTNFSLTDGAEAPPTIGNFSYMIVYDTAEEVTAAF